MDYIPKTVQNEIFDRLSNEPIKKGLSRFAYLKISVYFCAILVLTSINK